MKSLLLVAVFALGILGLSGCSSGTPTAPAAGAGGGPPPVDTGAGAGKDAKPRIPKGP